MKTCGAYNKARDCFCTRPAEHEGYHVATFGPFASAWATEIHRWPAEQAIGQVEKGGRRGGPER